MNNNNKISQKIVLIDATSDDGVLLSGELHYWSKDYTVYLKDPFEAKCGSHLMYASSAVYITTEEPREGIVGINILDRAKDGLIHLYQRGDAKLLEAEIDQKYRESLEEMRREKRELKSKLKSNLIDSREYQLCLTSINKAKSDLESEIIALKDAKC